MVERVPLTLFTHINSISAHAYWTDPLNSGDVWNGSPYQWRVAFNVQPQAHGDPTTPRPFTYNGYDVSIGDWLVFTSGGMALEIISIISRNDSILDVIVEDVGLHNLLNDRTQSGQGIGGVSGPDTYDCLIINLNASGVPVFANLTDYSVPVNMVSDITNRFQFRNYVQDFVPASQANHDFAVGEIIYIDVDGSYKKSLATDPGSVNSIGTVTSIDQPLVDDFTYRPLGRYVKNLPTLPGVPGNRLYVSELVPGGLTSTPPTDLAIPIYIKITNTSAILMSGSGGSASTGNIKIFSNTITSLNVNGNINITPNGNGVVNISTSNLGNIVGGSFTNLMPGRVVVVGPNGQLIDTSYFTFDVPGKALRVGNVTIGNDFIASAVEGKPLTLAGNESNVRITSTLDLNNNQIINVADPVEPQDVATKSYVDAVASGLNAKGAAVVATTTDLNAVFSPGVGWGSLTGTVYQSLTIDGVQPVVGDRILVRSQADTTQNGIYNVMQSGGVSQAWLLTRSSDFNGQGKAGKIESGDFVFVESGDTYGGTGWVLTSRNPITVNVTALTWTQFSSAGVIQAGFGLTKTGTVLDVNVAAIIDRSTGLSTIPGPSGHSLIEIYIESNTPLEFQSGALRVKDSIAGGGLTYDAVNGNLTINPNQPTIVQVGTVISGVWSADTISVSHGGTGLTTFGLAGQVLGVNDAGTGLEYIYSTRLTESEFAPTFPVPVDGDRWYSTTTGVLFTRITDDTGGHWIEV